MNELGFKAISVRQLNLYVKSLLEGNARLSSCFVSGEISNFKAHFSSGHLYFTLKDEFSSIKCVMFRGNAARCPITLKDGLKVICGGRVSLYEKDGNYQFYVEACFEDGVGSQAEKLALLKEKLLKEGLFAPENKRKIPVFPKCIAAVTSGGGAALQDVINIVSRRCPTCHIIVASVSVQGVNAVSEMISALDKLYSLDFVDTVIIGRGGGSSEDLSAFNDEALARKLYESPFPVISAVGHETDTSICDLVADLRAPTPSAAAELAAPDLSQLNTYAKSVMSKIAANVSKNCLLNSGRLGRVLNMSAFSHPTAFLEPHSLTLDRLSQRTKNAINTLYDNNAKQFKNAVIKIDAMSPLKVLARGYSVVQKDDKTVSSIQDVLVGESINIKLNDGSLGCTVDYKE